MPSTPKNPTHSHENTLDTLAALSHELKAILNYPAPSLEMIEGSYVQPLYFIYKTALADRTWKANIDFEQRGLQLEREKTELERAMKHVWSGFDNV
jgi:hypothetical protein